MGQQVGRVAGIADRADVRACVADPTDRVRIFKHFADDLEVAIGVVLKWVQQ
jgi:hypothetical protein